MMRRMSLGLMALGLTGCFTLSQADYPAVQMSRAPETAAAVALRGFEATVTSFVPVYGTMTVWNASPSYVHHGHHHRGYMYPETVTTTTYVPQTDLTTAYVEKAQELLESAGFVVSGANAARVVEVKFSGPAQSDGDVTAEVLTMLFSIFTADYTAETWSARLKISDPATGRVLLNQTYSQEYTACVWGPIPLFSPLTADAVDAGYIQNWCLSALTDRAMADATAFLAAERQAE